MNDSPGEVEVQVPFSRKTVALDIERLEIEHEVVVADQTAVGDRERVVGDAVGGRARRNHSMERERLEVLREELGASKRVEELELELESLNLGERGRRARRERCTVSS